MIIREPEPKVKKVDDLDITFTNGLMLPLTIDKEAGDKVDWDTHENAIVVHIAPHVTSDGEGKTMPEDFTIFRPHIAFIQHRVREVTELSPAQKRETWKQTLQELGGTIQ